jgi:apolipoprotein N-acyltransferase
MNETPTKTPSAHQIGLCIAFGILLTYFAWVFAQRGDALMAWLNGVMAALASIYAILGGLARILRRRTPS